MAKRVLLGAAAAPLVLIACSPSQSEDLPTEPPATVTMVTSGGFSAPTDAVASPDGKTFYFAAYDDQKEPAIFKTSAEAGSRAEMLAVGAPLAHPTGLVLSCDGSTLYVADLAAEQSEASELGAIFALPVSGGAVSDLAATGIARPAGLAMAADCKTLRITGRAEDGRAALFSMSAEGGAASIVYAGEPLVSPTGLHIDDDGVSWVMDHLAYGTNGEGVLFAIPADGSVATEVASDLRMGTPGGVSLTAGGGTAVMPTTDKNGNAQLTTVNIATGEMLQLAVPSMTDPAGLRTARKAGVFAVVDSEAGAIYRAE
jgi:DNA-binding beta-propeller fold protein YncE